ncbi:hypothetical protein TeGR_g2970 [Tetraparma gracilis]|uniref:Leucine-rich repeat-containing N-terminal plant-type domain-containing protein n=1 Tax=Tetraparma gracilis TaxID=2962635 RepID=A0ABQ6MS49_9STRA|nr:hypothetical protein TeGR_g2970 [Tetraparma gracilis]
MPPASLIRAEVPASEGDRAALVEIYQSTFGPGWLNSSGWLEGDPCLDAWLGVGCGEDGRVTTLGAGRSLWSNNMTGQLPPAINDLTALITLDLTYNPIGGGLPPIGYLRNLQSLLLQVNNFEGPLPPLDNLTSLVEVSLLQNSFSGSLPPLNNCTDLQGLKLGINKFTGTVPSSYSNLTSLTYLSLSSNALSGALPPLDNFHDLQVLNLYDNMFTGTVPSSYSNLTSLTVLQLQRNALSGALPPLDSLHDLQRLSLYDNMFTGTVPSSYSNLTSLTILDLHSNALSGTLPPLDSLHDLQYLYLYDNMCTGPLPDVANSPDLLIFLAHNNDFSSSLPPSLFSLPKLEAVILSGNSKLTGTLPAVLDAPSLTSLVIEGCDLSGPLPTSISSNLTALYLAGNRLESTIPPLPPTIVDVSLAYNELSGSLPDDFFADTPDLETFDIRHNKIGGSIPSSMSSLEHLADLKTDLNYMSGSLAADMESWPIFAASDTASTTSTILFGNIWSCPIEPAIRDHSDDEAHAYACGDSEFVTPILVAAAAFALFAAAAAFTKHENVYRLVCYYSRSKTVVLTDARKLVNVGYSCYKLVTAVLLASIGLSATYWNAHSAFDTQPALLKLSATLKTASDGFILPLLAITTLTLLYYIRWGWGMRFEGRVESELTGSGKPRSWRGTVKLAGLVAYVMATTTGFDFVYVFFVATNPRMSTSTRTLLNALLSQFKSSFLNERWAAKQALKLANPTKRFNYLVFTMSAIMLLNALVVPSVLVLLLDERCFKFYDFWLFGRLQTQAPHDVVVPYTYCNYVDTDGNPSCPNPNNPNDGYVTDYFSTTFEYPWSLSEQCGSAVIQS